MGRLRVQELAKQKGWTISDLQRESRISMPSARRYWYETKDGKATGPPLKMVDLDVMESIAKALGTALIELFQ